MNRFGFIGDSMNPDFAFFNITEGRNQVLNGLSCRLHRHTFATMLLERGVNPKVVQKLLGHRDIETTLEIYSHVLPEVFDGVAEMMDSIHSDILGGNCEARKRSESLGAQ